MTPSQLFRPLPFAGWSPVSRRRIEHLLAVRRPPKYTGSAIGTDVPLIALSSRQAISGYTFDYTFVAAFGHI